MSCDTYECVKWNNVYATQFACKQSNSIDNAEGKRIADKGTFNSHIIKAALGTGIWSYIDICIV